MSNKVFSLLPAGINEQSISSNELVLPLAEALAAVDAFEAGNIHVLSWEGWVKTPDGSIGHGNAPQGTGCLESLSVRKAAELCKTTMVQEAAIWERKFGATGKQLHFCITVGT
jgi:hypothetical protein